jgi:cytoskeletal protein CcmA (bactofilin family)
VGLFGKPEPNKSNPAPGGRRTPTPNNASPTAATTLIGPDAVITGEVNTSEVLQIEGRVEGKIKSSGLVVIGEAGRVKAEIEAENVSIRGKLEGDCTAKKRVEITRTGKVFGNLRAPLIAVAEGAIFRGASHMTVKEERPQAKERAPSGPPSPPASAPGPQPRSGAPEKAGPN